MSTGSLRILSPGLLTTVQDLGRPGWQRLGVPPAGALDTTSLRAANLLAGNPADAGALEIVGSGPTLRIEADSARIACVGAIAVIARARDGVTSQIPLGQSSTLLRGDILSVGRLDAGASLILAIEGGFAAEPALGSLSTDLRSALGGWRGCRLKAGDVLPLARRAVADRPEVRLRDLSCFSLPAPRHGDRFEIELRVLEGPQADHFTKEQRKAFYGRPYAIGAAWSRMAMKLVGTPIQSARGHDIVSDGIVRGAIQIPGDGQPIVMLAEHQTTGGYPKIAVVISADLPTLGRLTPGMRVVFRRVSLAEAETAARSHAAFIDHLPALIEPAPVATPADLAERLAALNLVSGVCHAQACNAYV